MGLFSFGNNNKRSASTLNWVRLNNEQDLKQLIEKESFDKSVVLFKHSTRCSISSMALNRLESDWDLDPEQVIPVYLDLIAFRSVSDKIAADLGVTHQSPQILMVKDGQCIYTASHSQINVEDLKERL